MRQFQIKRRNTLRLRRSVWRVVTLSSVCALFVGGLGYAVFFSGLFAVRHMAINGARIIDASALKAAAESYVDTIAQPEYLNANMLALVSGDLERAIRERFKVIASVRVEKHYPSRLVIEVREHAFAGIWCVERTQAYEEPEKCFVMDTEGILYDDAASISGTLVMVVKSPRPAVISDAVTDANTIHSLQFLHRQLRDRWGLAVNAFRFNAPPDMEASFVSDPWKLIFDASRNAPDTLYALEKTFTALGDRRSALTYIDLRVSHRSYYAFDGAEGFPEEITSD
ncbi:MAG: FtsQ-type POTRA domain-containing protein [bacterium]|nr:FtsQ-type POTRA domain-containing protein [bacterium]